MTLCKEVLNVNDELYIVQKILHENYCKDVDLLKQWFHCDTAFKKEHLVYFCEKIIDLEPEQ